MNRVNIYHRYFRLSGLYKLAGKSALRLLLVLVAIAVIMLVSQNLINDLGSKLEIFFHKWNPVSILAFFLISESFLGLIPPDFFIVWANTYDHNILLVSLLAILSYMGGIFSFAIGSKIRNIKKLDTYLEKKFDPYFEHTMRYGGFSIIIAALFPLPYSLVCYAAGMLQFPLQRLLIFGLARFLRFYIYAALLFNLI